MIKRYVAHGMDPGSRAQLEYEVLALFQANDVRVPEPVFLDRQGEILGAPTLVTRYISSETMWTSPDGLRCAREMALTLVRIHSAPVDSKLQDLLLDGNADVLWFVKPEGIPPYMPPRHAVCMIHPGRRNAGMNCGRSLLRLTEELGTDTMIALETERLLLRDFRPDDFDEFYAITEGPNYRRFYSEQEVTREFCRELLERFLRSIDVKERLMHQLAICLKTGEVIGTCGVRIEDRENQQASFGCGIAEPYWGTGLASEASRRILKYGFVELPIHRIYAETISANTRARSLAEGLGMHLDGELRQNRFFRGRWWNTAIYSILKHEWDANA